VDIKKRIDSVLQQEVDRKQFLAQIGMAGLAVFGVTNLIKGLSEKQPGSTGSGYGSSAYGGSNRKLGTINRRIN
jgi:hypothetical protein